MTRIGAGTRDYLASRGWHVMFARQSPADDGRKLKRVPIPADPWMIVLIDHPNALEATAQRHATAATLAEAIAAALPSSGGLKSALARLSAAMDALAGAYR